MATGDQGIESLIDFSTPLSRRITEVTVIEKAVTTNIFIFGKDQSAKAIDILNSLEQLKYEPTPASEEYGGSIINFVDAHDNRDLLRVTLDKESLHIQGREDQSGCHFIVEVDEDGIMRFDALLISKNPATGESERDPYIPNFTKLFDISLNFFSRNGINVRSIESQWDAEVPGAPESTNYKVFNESLNSGLSPEEAALTTPTGRIYNRHGFSKVQFTNIPQSSSDSATLLFMRPNAA